MAASQATSTPFGTDNLWYSAPAAAAELYAARSHTGLGGSMQMRKVLPLWAFDATNSNAWASGMKGMPYPNPADSGLYLARHLLFEHADGCLRGNSPGFYGCPQAVASGTFGNVDRVAGFEDLPGRTLIAIVGGNAAGGVSFLDVTGPWR